MAFDKLATITYTRGNPIALGNAFRSVYRELDSQGDAKSGAGLFVNMATQQALTDAGLTASPAGFVAFAADRDTRVPFLDWAPENFATTDGVSATGLVRGLRKRIFDLDRADNEVIYMLYRFKLSGDPGGWITIHARHDGGLTTTYGVALTVDTAGLKAIGIGTAQDMRLDDLFYDNQEVEMIPSDRATFEFGQSWDAIFDQSGFATSDVWVRVQDSSASQLLNVVSGAPVRQRSITLITPYSDFVERGVSLIFEGTRYVIYNVAQVGRSRDYEILAVQDLR